MFGTPSTTSTFSTTADPISDEEDTSQDEEDSRSPSSTENTYRDTLNSMTGLLEQFLLCKYKMKQPIMRKTCWRLSTQDTLTDLPRFSIEPLNTLRLSLQLTWRKLTQPSSPMTLSANWTCPTMGGCGMVGAYLRLVSWWQFWVWSSWRATVPLRKTSGNSWIWCEYTLGENISSTESQEAHHQRLSDDEVHGVPPGCPQRSSMLRVPVGPRSPCWNQQNESPGIFGKSQW